MSLRANDRTGGPSPALGVLGVRGGMVSEAGPSPADGTQFGSTVAPPVEVWGVPPLGAPVPVRVPGEAPPLAAAVAAGALAAKKTRMRAAVRRTVLLSARRGTREAPQRNVRPARMQSCRLG